jgi:hypothetical protein
VILTTTSHFLFDDTPGRQRAAQGVGADALDLISETFLISPQAIASTSLNDLIEIEEEVFLFLRLSITGQKRRARTFLSSRNRTVILLV